MSHPGDVMTLESWIERTATGRPVLFKIQAHGDLLLLRAGEREWELNDPELSFSFASNDTAVTSTFVVRRAGVPEFTFRYLHVGRSLASRLDPTYDALDFEMDHKLSLVAQFASSPEWQAAYIRFKQGAPSAA